MKNDARFLLNKKKWKNSGNRPLEVQRGGSRPQLDARKIINSKRAKHTVPNKQFVRGVQKFNKSPKGIFTKAFAANSIVPDKRIKVTNDGNILITAKSNETQMVARPPQRISSFGKNAIAGASQIQKPVHQWAPADIEMDNLEHIGINDLLDMESLPPAVVMPNIPQHRLTLSRSLAEGLSGVQNTMVADQIASTSAYQAVRVYVSNLHSSVSKQDIMELFGDVGIIKSVQMHQPGSAVVEFFTEDDAAKACNIYHNRLLDGHPMKCYLTADVTPPSKSVSQRLGGRVQSVSPIASTSSLMSNPRSRYNPRDVRFTVKLT